MSLTAAARPYEFAFEAQAAPSSLIADAETAIGCTPRESVVQAVAAEDIISAGPVPRARASVEQSSQGAVRAQGESPLPTTLAAEPKAK